MLSRAATIRSWRQTLATHYGRPITEVRLSASDLAYAIAQLIHERALAEAQYCLRHDEPLPAHTDSDAPTLYERARQAHFDRLLAVRQAQEVTAQSAWLDSLIAQKKHHNG